MTDEEIQQSFRICLTETTIEECRNCAYHEQYPYKCQFRMHKDAMNLLERLQSENAALRERLEKTEKEIDEYKNKIEYGKLVEPVWFISFMNDLPCYGRVIGYQEDSGFVMECTDCMISAKEIYFSEKEVLDSLAELKGGKE